MASDAYAGFHGDQLKPYWQPVGAGPLTRVADSVVLYRVSRSYGDSKDREHRFVTSSEELVSLRKQGWVYDGSKGFVHRTP